jgi:hypothetical protein
MRDITKLKRMGVFGLAKIGGIYTHRIRAVVITESNSVKTLKPKALYVIG